jgi:ferrochelatase
MVYLTESLKQQDKQTKTGILLINLGTPEAPTAKAVRPYLKEFLSDPRVVELPRWLWWPILNGIILTFRPGKSAQKYAQIWTSEGSPLKVHTERQTKLLKGVLGEKSRGAYVIDYAMRYGAPSVASIISKLKHEGCSRILVVPLYPQYAASSSASALDAVFDTLTHTRDQPALRTITSFHDHPDYIAALAQSVHDHRMLQGRGDILVMSFHGIPRKSVEQGDPYQQQCLATGELLAQALGLSKEQYRITFQSRFGAAEWLKPYTADSLAELGKSGINRVDVICPGFVADCLETLEEIAMEGKATFLNAGGKEFSYIPALNERPDWIAALTDIVQANLQGW